jgi:hypothetical protein
MRLSILCPLEIVSIDRLPDPLTDIFWPRGDAWT